MPDLRFTVNVQGVLSSVCVCISDRVTAVWILILSIICLQP